MQFANLRLALSLIVLMIINGSMTGCALWQTPESSELGYSTGQPMYGEEAEDELIPGTIATTNRIKEISGYGPKPEMAKENFAKGKEFFAAASQQLQAAAQNPEARQTATENFRQADQLFETAAARWPNSPIEQEALFKSAESSFFHDAYVRARDRFELLIKKYPNTRYMDTVSRRRFEIAEYWLQLEDTNPEAFYHFNFTDKQRPLRDIFGHAVRVIDKIRLEDPTGDLADDATLLAAEAYFKRGDYDKADEYYSDLRQNFPSSDLQFAAHFNGLLAKLQRYRGPQYSTETLKEAEKLIRQMRRQFPRQTAERSTELDKSFKYVRSRQAEYAWTMGKYYDDRGQNRAASFYYQNVAQEFQDTPYGQRASERLQAISGRPAQPPQRLSWLVNIFPEREDSKPLIPNSTTGTLLR